jgi:hypothetical protein
MSFAAPAVLFALIALPAIWWLLRLMPPRPKSEAFPPARILAELTPKEETPAQTPWWLTALRLALAALLIFALAGPALRSGQDEAPGAGPLLLIVDNGWASAGNWTAIRDGALAIAEFAERAERPVALFATAEPSGGVVAPADPGEIADRILSLEPQPFAPDYAAALPQLRTIADTASFGGAAWISDGLHHEGADDLVDLLAEMVAGPVTVYRDSDRLVLGLAPPANGVDGLDVPVLRQDGEAAAEGVVIARDLRGRAIGEAGFAFAAGETRTEATFDVPPDLRNEIVRLEITGEATAGAVQLLDDRYRRRTVGLLSSEPSEQPLLSAEYYLSRALLPFADLATSSGDVGQSLIDMIQSGISVIVLADFGTLPADAEAALTDWVEAGGTLVQFAGPRLAASEPTLIPVPLRQGGRVLGGALSWEEPQPLGPFPRTSPFFGLDVPDDVLVQRQVLAEPSAALTDRVWANLADGTPLVTGGALGDGLLVLFHVTADTEWSNLPLSGVFVEMLRRITSLAAAPEGDAAGDAIATALPPYRVLDGYGRFTDPGPAAEPLSGTLTDLLVGAAHPPGFYGAEDLFRAVSLLGADAELAPFDVATIEGADAAALPGATAIELRPWLLAAVLALLLADTLAVLWLSGALAGRRPQIAALVLAALLLPALPSDGNAQNELTPADLFALQAANNTALAYVVTGDPANDEISRAGLTGLSWVLRQRTSFEPPDPIGVDIATDELAFFPILYWRVAPEAPMPAPDAIARLETYLRNGGIILFDTADELQRTTADIAQATTAAGTYLRDMLATVDIPPLEPVPVDHVLTKTYYLIQDFPGRYTGGAFWVEILADAPELAENRPARPTDGISPIMVTSNDLAGAWAIDDNGAFLFPMANNDPRLREMSFRAGVNIVMYALTGNYKTDQVHVPDLLERLGQ